MYASRFVTYFNRCCSTINKEKHFMHLTPNNSKLKFFDTYFIVHRGLLLQYNSSKNRIQICVWFDASFEFCFLFAFLFWMFGFVYKPALLTWKSSVPTHHQEPLTRLRYTSSILLTLLFFRLKYISYHSEERSS